MHLRVKVLDNLGCGLSVASLCAKLNISYEELCSLAQEDTEVYNQLKRWYPKYDFLAEPKKEDKPLKRQRKTKEVKETNDKEVSQEQTTSEGKENVSEREQVSGE